MPITSGKKHPVGRGLKKERSTYVIDPTAPSSCGFGHPNINGLRPVLTNSAATSLEECDGSPIGATGASHNCLGLPNRLSQPSGSSSKVSDVRQEDVGLARELNLEHLCPGPTNCNIGGRVWRCYNICSQLSGTLGQESTSDAKLTVQPL